MEEGGTLFLWGDWTVYTLTACEDLLERVLPGWNAPSGEGAEGAHGPSPAPEADFFPMILALEGIHKMDTAGALLLNSLAGASPAGLVPVVRTDNADFRTLLEISQPAAGEVKRALPPWPARFLHKLGSKILEETYLMGQLLSFFGAFTLYTLRLLRHPGGLRLAAAVSQMERVGLHALPIVCLLNFLIGMVIAYMSASSLAFFGAQIYVVNLLEVVVLREMGVLITAILAAGRSGSAFTAQLGFMVYNQEVDAMRSMGLDPMAALIFPRILALCLSLPCLTLAADMAALLGGLVSVWGSMDISPTVFVHTLQQSISVEHILVGLVKAPFFALAIGCVGCFLGMKVTGGSDSIGALTTRSVVEGIFLVITLNAAFALFFNAAGI
jgi:phospholipid/cholesterol/gamma-HCH transport system permease protein